MRNILVSLAAFLALTAQAPAQKQYGFDNGKPSGQPYLTPKETVARMKVPPGFKVDVFAGEPMVVNPIAFTVDERGRLWVVECFEYPSRTPAGKMPRDRIIILEDTDGDGVADKRTVFCEGKDFPVRFDLASGIEVGHGGVFLGAAPYLWFIENKNDKPGKFEILLKGFGSQDTHETLNTFQWGPDGWLYGLHGIFTNSDVNGVKINGAVWRYEPRSRKFEQFAEGTSNPWGWDFRNTDGQMIVCCCVIPHLFHIVPGGIYKRQAGASQNPYAYGYLNEICDHTFHKESGWAHAGLLSLDTPIMPPEYRDSVIFGSIHGNSIKRNVLKRNGSTYTASRADDFLTSGDKNFRPINMRWGPSGEIYLIDWHDQNPCHQAAAGSWDYQRGRVYRIDPPGVTAKRAPDLSKLSPSQLLGPYGPRLDQEIEHLMSKYIVKSKETSVLSPWWERTTRRVRFERLLEVYKALAPSILESKYERLVWETSVFRRGDEATLLARYRVSLDAWQHSRMPQGNKNPLDYVWGDISREFNEVAELSTSGVSVLTHIAMIAEAPMTRLNIASVLQRHRSNADVVTTLHELLIHKEDAADPAIPLMLWYAYEPRLAAKPQAELVRLRTNAPGNPLITDHILARAVRRVVALDTPDSVAKAVAFVDSLTDAAQLKALEGLATALEGRTVEPPPEWGHLYGKLVDNPTAKPFLRKIAVSFRDAAVLTKAYAVAHDISKPAHERADAVQALAQLKDPRSLTLCLSMVGQEVDPLVRREAMRALTHFDAPNVATDVLKHWPHLPPAIRSEGVNVLAGRKTWAKTLLAAVEAKTVSATELNTNVVLRMAAFKDKQIDQAIQRVWGPVRAATADMTKLIDTQRNVLAAGPASFIRGKKVFTDQCAKCHTFEGAGHNVGPVLDGAGRDVEYLLVNILDPNRVVGAPYQLRRAILNNGRIEEGMFVGEDANSVTLKQENDQTKIIARKDIEELQVSEKSVMPEGLTKPVSDQDFRDLIRYLMAHPPLTEWELAGKPVSLSLLAPLTLPADGKATATITAPAALSTKLQLNATAGLRVLLDGKVVFNGKPENAEIAVHLAGGPHKLTIEAPAGGTVTARFLDPDRRLAQ